MFKYLPILAFISAAVLLVYYPHVMDDADILARAFALYCRYHPPQAAAIGDIYQRNVSRWYAYRNSHLVWMRKFPAR